MMCNSHSPKKLRFCFGIFHKGNRKLRPSERPPANVLDEKTSCTIFLSASQTRAELTCRALRQCRRLSAPCPLPRCAAHLLTLPNQLFAFSCAELPRPGGAVPVLGSTRSARRHLHVGMAPTGSSSLCPPSPKSVSPQPLLSQNTAENSSVHWEHPLLTSLGRGATEAG